MPRYNKHLRQSKRDHWSPRNPDSVRSGRTSRSRSPRSDGGDRERRDRVSLSPTWSPSPPRTQTWTSSQSYSPTSPNWSRSNSTSYPSPRSPTYSVLREQVPEQDAGFPSYSTRSVSSRPDSRGYTDYAHSDQPSEHTSYDLERELDECLSPYSDYGDEFDDYPEPSDYDEDDLDDGPSENESLCVRQNGRKRSRAPSLESSDNNVPDTFSDNEFREPPSKRHPARRSPSPSRRYDFHTAEMPERPPPFVHLVVTSAQYKPYGPFRHQTQKVFATEVDAQQFAFDWTWRKYVKFEEYPASRDLIMGGPLGEFGWYTPEGWKGMYFAAWVESRRLE